MFFDHDYDFFMSLYFHQFLFYACRCHCFNTLNFMIVLSSWRIEYNRKEKVYLSLLIISDSYL